MEDVSSKKLTVLVADDDEDLLQIMEANMKSEGFRVKISPNADNIMEIIESDPPDIILLDIVMQGINGSSICRQLKSKQKTSHIPILLFSDNHDIKKIAAECGADGAISKPFDSKKITEEMYRTLGYSNKG